jgi:hypothetical protein
MPVRARSSEGLGVTARCAQLLQLHLSCFACRYAELTRTQPLNREVTSLGGKRQGLTCLALTDVSYVYLMARGIAGEVTDIHSVDKTGHQTSVGRR